MRRRKTPEHEMQKQIAQYLNFALPVDCFWTSIDHAGGGRLAGALRKARGVRAGLADIWIVYKSKLLCVELKTPSGTISDEQLTTAHHLARAGAPTATVRTISELEYALGGFGIPLRARLAGEPAAVKAARSTA